MAARGCEPQALMIFPGVVDMKRRQFVGAMGVGAAGASLMACSGTQDCATAAGGPQVEQEKYKWKLITSWPKNFPGLGAAPENLAKIINKASNGRLTIKVFGAGELMPALEVFDGVSQGTAEMGHTAAYYWKGKMPAAPFFTAVPFGLNAQEMNAWFSYGGAIELWHELYKPFGLRAYPGGSTGVQMAGWFNKEINSLDDVKGLKMRIPGMAGEVWKRIGGVPVTLPGGELFVALQTGTIDATEWVGPYNDMTFGLHQAAKYYYYPGWHEPGAMLEFQINEAAYQSLPEDLQALLRSAMQAVNQDMLDEYTARNNQALVDLIEKHNVQLRRLPDEVLKKLKETSHQVVKEAGETSELAKKIYASFLEFEKGVKNYHKISELAYYKARA